MTVATKHGAGEIIEQLLRTGTVYLAQFTADPTKDGLQTNEFTGGAYARQVITFDAHTDTALGAKTQNSATVTFPTATANLGQATHWGIMDAASAGNMLFFGPWDSPKTVNNGDDYSVEVGKLVVEVN